MTNYQAFMMGMTAALLPSFALLVLLFLRSRILLGRTFVLTQQPPEQSAKMLRIIRGGRAVDDLLNHVSGYHHLRLVENVSVVPTFKHQPQNSWS